MRNALVNVPADQPSVTAVPMVGTHGTPHGSTHGSTQGSTQGITRGRYQAPPADRPDIKLTPPGQIRVEPLRNGSWLIRIGRDRGEKRFQLSRAEAAGLVRLLSRDVLTPAELNQ